MDEYSRSKGSDVRGENVTSHEWPVKIFNILSGYCVGKIWSTLPQGESLRGSVVFGFKLYCCFLCNSVDLVTRVVELSCAFWVLVLDLWAFLFLRCISCGLIFELSSEMFVMASSYWNMEWNYTNKNRSQYMLVCVRLTILWTISKGKWIVKTVKRK